MSSLVRTELCASFEEGIVNVKKRYPARVGAQETVTWVAAAPIANGDRKHAILGV